MTHNKTKSIISHAISGIQSDVLLSAADEGKRVITFDEIRKRSGLSRERLRPVLVELVKREWLKRINRGLYVIVPVEAGKERLFTEPPFIIAKHMMPDGAISHWSAFNYHGFTDQLPKDVYMSGTRRMRNREVMGLRYIFVFMGEKSFFGHEDIWVENEKVRITDAERTLIDALWMPKHCGGMSLILESLDSDSVSKLDSQKLGNYLQKLGRTVLFKRLGFIADLLGWKIPHTEAWLKMIDKNYNLLDPDGPKKGRVDSKWRLKINMDIG
jgi:predicted transcriptional regulator of viral defense system